MKKIIMTMVALLTMTAGMAQNENGERKAPKKLSPEELTNRMVKDLNLSNDQKAKVLKLNKEYEQVLGHPGMKRGKGPRGPKRDGDSGATEQAKPDKQQLKKGDRPEMSEQQKAEMKQHMVKRQEYEQKLKQILTDDQYKNYQKMHKRGPRPDGNGGKDRRRQHQEQ